MELSLRRYQKFGLASAGVLLGLSAGLVLANNQAHADSTPTSTATVVSSASSSDASSDKSNDKTFAQKVLDEQAQHAKANNANQSQDGTEDTYHMTVDVQFENGEKLPAYDPASRADKALAVQTLEDTNYKEGDSYDFSALDPSNSPDYDVLKIVDDDGNELPVQGKMPAHDVHAHIIIAPTGDRTIEDDDFHKAIVKYQNAHGLPKDIKHQAYGGMSQDEVDKDNEEQAKKDQQVVDDLDHKGSSSTTDGINTHKNTGNNKNNAKRVTLTFRVMYNGQLYGKETLSNLTPGTQYNDQKLRDLQNRLKQGGLSLSDDSLKLLSGTVPDDDQTFDLQIVNADNSKSSGKGTQTNDAVKDSLGDDGTSSTDASDGSSTGDSSANSPSLSSDDVAANAPGDTNTEAPYDGSNSPDTNQQAANGSSANQNNPQNQQTLPQTGSISSVAQAGLLLLGISSLSLGVILLKKKQA